MQSLLEACGISKSFAGVRVLDGVSLSVNSGEIHALVGENGAGKSTLMKVLTGLHSPDAGELRLDGQPVRFRNAHAAKTAGIAMIHQEPLPFLNLTVAENVFIGQEPTSFPGWIDKPALHRQTERLLAQLGLALSPSQKMRDLTVAETQSVEILKALAHNARLIIMDEPTSALSDHEVAALFRLILDLKERGTAVIYISHRLEEIFRLADRVTVLRDGCHVVTQPMAEVSRDQLVTLMVGRPLAARTRTPGISIGPVTLSVRGLGKTRRFQDASFDARRGEILGIAGLMGAGRTDLLNAIYGLDPADSGEIFVNGRRVSIAGPRDALNAGIGLVSEDRKRFGFVPRFGVKQNVTLAALRRWCRLGCVDHFAENRLADEQIRAFRIRTAGRNQPVVRLSGGNQQKVVLARSLLAEPEILLLDEPTRGIDIAAKAEVHELIAALARAGKTIILVSSELPEVLSLSHRLLVMREGQLTAELDPATTSQEEIMKFAMPN